MESEDLKDWLPAFLSDFHTTHLKPRRYKKVSRTFSRDMGDYWERVNFQGSMSNYEGKKRWRFYLNIGVEFKDLETRQWWKLFPHTHVSWRADQLTSKSPKQWEYRLDTDSEKLKARLAEAIDAASKRIAGEIKAIREKYEAGRKLW